MKVIVYYYITSSSPAVNESYVSDRHAFTLQGFRIGNASEKITKQHVMNYETTGFSSIVSFNGLQSVGKQSNGTLQ
jgi:hypothetical protein